MQLKEITDEDGFPCEDVNELTQWIQRMFSETLLKKELEVKAVNFSAYGASFVYVNKEGNVIAPLYNYLKPYPEQLRKTFYEKYGGEDKIAKETASPVLGSLNSGMQLYRLKYEKPALFEQITFAFHLPQYLSYIFADFPVSEITSIGCHTGLWNFQENNYHSWVTKEQIGRMFPFIVPSSCSFSFPPNSQGIETEVGAGLHDSSAALVPYLLTFHEPFVLISTGTWSISLNPFNQSKLTSDELRQDCLCYLSYEGKPVKASRLFAGYEHDQQVKRLAEHFDISIENFQNVEYNPAFFENFTGNEPAEEVAFSEIELSEFTTYKEAYHALMASIVKQQMKSTNLVLRGTEVKRIFVDGGFGKNSIFMNLLAKEFPGTEVYGARVPHASALGAALAIHKSWNKNPLPADLIELIYYSNSEVNHPL